MKKYFFVLCLSCFSTLAFSQFTTSGNDLYHLLGNVGIGTSTPSYKAEIYSGSFGISGGSEAFLEFHSLYSSTSYKKWRMAIGGGQSAFSMTTRNDDGTKKADILTLTNSGNLGLGNTSPGSSLHITTSDSKGIKFSRTGANDFGYEIEGTGFGLYDYTSGEYKWKTFGGDIMLAETSGSVGIGTTTPSAKLDVNGTAIISGSTTLNNSVTVSSNGQTTINNPLYLNNQVRMNTNSSVGLLFTNENASHGVGTKSNTFRLIADSDGDGTGNISHEIGGVNNVLTNLNSNSYTINVKTIVHGDIESSKIRVSTNPGNWPDYVFESSYKLKPLDEVEAFINKNQHLPEVPSAKEVEANGLDLGDMDATLLKKMEELTLYMIELNKTVKAQEDRIKQLEMENNTLKKKTK